MGFVGNYAPCGLSPQTDGMPVIPKKEARFRELLFQPKRQRSLRSLHTASLCCCPFFYANAKKTAYLHRLFF